MVYIFFAHGFEEIEAIAPLDILRRADIAVHAVGIGSKTITGSHGLTIHCDMLDKQATNAKGLEMIVLPGGPGVAALEKSPVVGAYIEHVLKNGLWIAAICAAPSILGGRGLLNGKRATCYPSVADKLGEGATCTGEPVEVDGKLITSRGAGTALEFALKLVEALRGKEKADEIRKAIQM
jgi:4-methyl-5(b-hydroxyethyl)-thiazole monophosphate biosynthesis